MPPALVDAVVVVALLCGLVAGLRAGFFAALGALVGLVCGALVVPWVLPFVAARIPEGWWRGAAIVGAAIAVLAVGAAIGRAVGSLLRRGADHLRLRAPERLFGGLFGLIAALAVVALTGSGVAASGVPGLSSAVASSSALRTLDRLTPGPLDEAFARLHAAVLGDTVLPTLDGLLDDELFAVADDRFDIDTDDPALAVAAASVARISGIAYGCGTVPTGSGFVIAEDLVVTNAHVVAGIDTPMVELPDEPARDGRIVYFDPVDDLAVIAVDVDAAPLAVDGEALVAGETAAVQGYPLGGPFRTVGATVLRSGPLTVPDISGSSAAARSVYVLAANVEPGNSGGPLLTRAGEVAGVVFARDDAREDVGYAMAADELLPVVAALEEPLAPVSSGACLR